MVAWPKAEAGPRREWAAGTNTVMSLRPLPDGGLLVGAADPWLAVLDAAGVPRWVNRRPRPSCGGRCASPPTASWSTSAMRLGERPGQLRLGAPGAHPRPAGGRADPAPEQVTLVDDMGGYVHPTLDGAPLGLAPYEISRSLAIASDGHRFVLGTDRWLRAFDDGTPRWTQPAPAPVWATTITADGRLVVAAAGDGTIRWYRLEDGREVLALFPLVDRRNWVAWTPEGIYAATPGAHGVLRWHVNRGWDAPAEAIPVAEIPETYRPEAIRLVLQTLDTPRAIGLAVLAEMRAAIQRRTGAAVAPGAKLHVLTVGVSDYGQTATHLKLGFAAADATDVAAALQHADSLYAASIRNV